MPSSLEALEAIGEQVGRDALERFEEVLELAALAEHEIAQDEDGPAVADDVQRACDGAADLSFVGPFQGAKPPAFL